VQEMQLFRSQWNFQRLSMIEDALDRIDRQTYGRCEGCGGPIREKRLAAVPWARLCLACKQEEEASRLTEVG
jgi:DnaK suppressor protein